MKDYKKQCESGWEQSHLKNETADLKNPWREGCKEKDQPTDEAPVSYTRREES
jgi:hypothetical protein